jgi:hypothetical protein
MGNLIKEVFDNIGIYYSALSEVILKIVLIVLGIINTRLIKTAHHL